MLKSTGGEKQQDRQEQSQIILDIFQILKKEELNRKIIRNGIFNRSLP